ncbi:hypothetical protein KIN20_033655 [Parelaphostrongylus tenuis]|uniref:Uncharacterized protein n=1 Tax=Parelaphostrongylus tenuis TaxID=148309 RepID=A0AAD5R8D3_PARTN|nr:hypothetical protein KIN20_033655 [Parelaphostrongylus tenuis]
MVYDRAKVSRWRVHIQTLRELIRIREEECYLPTTSQNANFDDTSEEESDENADDEKDHPSSSFSHRSGSYELREGGLTETTGQENVTTDRNITLPVERDIMKLLEKSTGQTEEFRDKLHTILFWLRFYRLLGPQFLHDLQQEKPQRKTDLNAQRQAYALYYQNQGKQGKENDSCFQDNEILKNLEDLRDLMSTMEEESGPH